MKKLTGKTALVSGGGIGIGRAIAQRLAADGASVLIADINLKLARETAASIRAAGGAADAVQCDVGDYDQVVAAVDHGTKSYGGIDILVNNAGINPMGTIVETTLEQFNNTFRVNVNGVFHGCKAVGPQMMERRSGKIVNISSWYGKIGKHSYGAYCSSKFAVIGLTQSMAMEMAEYNVNVNSVCPGTIVETAMREETDRAAIRLGRPTSAQRAGQIPLGRVGLPNDIAKIVAFLASSESDYMTGQALNVTGGLWMH